MKRLLLVGVMILAVPACKFSIDILFPEGRCYVVVDSASDTVKSSPQDTVASLRCARGP